MDPPPVVALLKMVSFGDRPAERERDLEDIAHLLDTYVEATSERRWDEAADCGEFDLAPAYLLGADIARLLMGDAHKAIGATFCGRSKSQIRCIRADAQPWTRAVGRRGRRLGKAPRGFQAGMRRALGP